MWRKSPAKPFRVLHNLMLKSHAAQRVLVATPSLIGEIEEDLLVQQPEGCEKPSQQGCRMVCRLRRSLFRAYSSCQGSGSNGCSRRLTGENLFAGMQMQVCIFSKQHTCILCTSWCMSMISNWRGKGLLGAAYLCAAAARDVWCENRAS
jgi:hypothetical protein